MRKQVPFIIIVSIFVFSTVISLAVPQVLSPIIFVFIFSIVAAIFSMLGKKEITAGQRSIALNPLNVFVVDFMAPVGQLCIISNQFITEICDIAFKIY